MINNSYFPRPPSPPRVSRWKRKRSEISSSPNHSDSPSVLEHVTDNTSVHLDNSSALEQETELDTSLIPQLDGSAGPSADLSDEQVDSPAPHFSEPAGAPHLVMQAPSGVPFPPGMEAHLQSYQLEALVHLQETYANLGQIWNVSGRSAAPVEPINIREEDSEASDDEHFSDLVNLVTKQKSR